MDDTAAGRDPLRMRPIGLALFAAVLGGPAAAQATVALPGGTGNIEVSARWTVLGEAELQAESRPTDPEAEPGRSLLLNTIAGLRADGRTKQNKLLHMPGTLPGTIRLMNVYSADIATTSEELLSDERVEQIKRAIGEVLQAPGVEVVFHHREAPDYLGIGGLSLTFRVEAAGGPFFDQFVIVPAGDRLQYFETKFSAGDLDAPTAIAAVIRTFDGAREESDNDTLSKMLLGGAAGAVAGVAVALLRRRRRMRPRIGVDGARGGTKP